VIEITNTVWLKMNNDLAVEHQNYRPLNVLLALPPHAWVTPDEAAIILSTTKNALAMRRSRGEWPHATKLGPRLVRYRLGELLQIE
jgi:hypothetical protein